MKSKPSFLGKKSHSLTSPTRGICVLQTLHLKDTSHYLALGGTGWPRPVGCLKLQVIFRKRGTNYRALLRKTIYIENASYGPLPPCRDTILYIHMYIHFGATLSSPKLKVTFISRRVYVNMTHIFMFLNIYLHARKWRSSICNCLSRETQFSFSVLVMYDIDVYIYMYMIYIYIYIYIYLYTYIYMYMYIYIYIYIYMYIYIYIYMHTHM